MILTRRNFIIISGATVFWPLISKASDQPSVDKNKIKKVFVDIWNKKNFKNDNSKPDISINKYGGTSVKRVMDINNKLYHVAAKGCYYTPSGRLHEIDVGDIGKSLMCPELITATQIYGRTFDTSIVSIVDTKIDGVVDKALDYLSKEYITPTAGNWRHYTRVYKEQIEDLSNYFV